MIALARVTKPVGLKGAVRVDLLCDSPERLLEVKRTYRGPGPEDAVPITLMEVEQRGKNVVVVFPDSTTREEAEALRDHYIFIEESESVPSPDGTPRVHELTGCAVHGPEGEKLGIVEDVYDLPGSRMLGVRTDEGGGEVLVPFVDAWVRGFDTVKKRIDLTSDELFTEL